MLEQTVPDHPLWTFSIDLYQRHGVAEACLALQDRCGADVNLLLTVTWLASQQRLVNRQLLVELERLSIDWRRYCLQPLREVRRHLKLQPASESVYQQCKALELAAERWQQDRLYSCCDDNLASLPIAKGFASYQKNLQLYVQSLPEQTAEQTALSEALIARLSVHLG